MLSKAVHLLLLLPPLQLNDMMAMALGGRAAEQVGR